jgi:hypothetical protein
LLPIISLTSLHFFVKYEKIEEEVLVNHKVNDVEEDMYKTMSEHPEDVYTPKTDTKTFNVEVGNVPKEEVEEYVEKVKEGLKKDVSSELVEAESKIDKVVSGEVLNDLVKIETIEQDEASITNK